MAAIILVVLQIFLLLLKAHYTRHDDQEQAMEHMRAAQAKLDELAESFEQKLRYSLPNAEGIDYVEDALDKEKHHDPHP
jgi:type II secretory pathway component PulM